jgi:hypothetical protein
MQFGTAMIRWAEASQQRKARREEMRREHTGRTYRIARQQAESERERAQQRASMMFGSPR